MSAFVRWFAVHPVQAFVWLYAHIEPMSMPACSSAAAASPAGVPRDASGCARAGATVAAALPAVAPPRLLGGFAGSGRRFRHGSGLLCGFRRGRSPSAPPTWENAGAARRFGPIWPAKPPRSCERGSRATEVAHLDTCSDSVSAGRRSRMSKRLKPTGVRAISRKLV